jgi:hypothetical protein
MIHSRAATFRRVDLVLRFVRLGILAALSVAAVAAFLERTTISRECSGAFSREFDGGFERYRCGLVIRFIRNGYRLELPVLPR